MCVATVIKRLRMPDTNMHEAYILYNLEGSDGTRKVHHCVFTVRLLAVVFQDSGLRVFGAAWDCFFHRCKTLQCLDPTVLLKYE